MSEIAVDESKLERAILGTICIDCQTCVPIAVATSLADDWFIDDSCRTLWLSIVSLWDAGKLATTDGITIWNEFKRVASSDLILKQKKLAPRVDVDFYQSVLDAAVSSANLEYHIGELRNLHILRQIKVASTRAVVDAKKTDATSAAVGLRTDIDNILTGSAASADKRVNLSAVCRELLGEYEIAYQKRIVEKDLTWCPGFRFPWEPMTNLLNGLEPGLGIIAARPSVGKTLFALNLIRFWCDTGIHVVFNSLDMEQHSLTRRFIAERARVSIKKARFSPTQADIAAMKRAVDEMNDWPLSMVEIRDVEEFCSFCAIEHAAGRCQIAVVDYLGLLHSARVDNANEYARVSYVSDKLKSLANRLRIPVIALAQLNREITKDGVNRLPALADLRGSGSIEQDAFWVLFLHRDERTVNGVWKEQPPNQLVPAGSSPAAIRALDTILAVLCKAQNGELGSLPFVFRKNYLTCSLGDWKELPVKRSQGYGSTAREYLDYSAQFARVCSDWRHDPIEQVMRENGCLIEMRDPMRGTPSLGI